MDLIEKIALKISEYRKGSEVAWDEDTELAKYIVPIIQQELFKTTNGITEEWCAKVVGLGYPSEYYDCVYPSDFVKLAIIIHKEIKEKATKFFETEYKDCDNDTVSYWRYQINGFLASLEGE